MKRSILLIILVVLSCTVLSGCGTIVKEVKQATPVNTVDADAEDEIIMVMTINDTKVDVTWENNASVAELKELAEDELTISMSMYGGFEQVGPIGKSITRDDKQTTTSAGDIVLYSGNQLVVFYGSNSWAYTRIGKINLTEKELTNLLSNGDVTITLSME
jgi:outer membrane murein-binding lipoprotein Lpp